MFIHYSFFLFFFFFSSRRRHTRCGRDWSSDVCSSDLQIQKRIDELENEVERVVGRLKFLNDRVKYSTLNIEIYQHIKHEKAQVEEDGFFTRLWEGLTKGWDRFLNFIIGLATNWSLFLILAVIVYFVMKLWRRRKGRK